MQRKEEAAGRRAELAAGLANLEQQENHLKQSQATLEPKIEALRSKKHELTSLYSATQAQLRVQEALAGISEDLLDLRPDPSGHRPGYRLSQNRQARPRRVAAHHRRNHRPRPCLSAPDSFASYAGCGHDSATQKKQLYRSRNRSLNGERSACDERLEWFLSFNQCNTLTDKQAMLRSNEQHSLVDKNLTF